MRVVQYTAETDENGRLIPPTPNASRNGESNIWVVPVSELAILPTEAQLLAAPASVGSIPTRGDLPDGHPHKGEKIPTGPFNAGTTPEAMRIVTGGNWERAVDGVWYPWLNENGDLALPPED